jgi:tetratricopeptide (TPR) repeat protein
MEIERAMLDTSATFAASAWTRLESNVDAWTTAWISAHRDACEATRVRGEQSERLLDLRMSCLESRRVRMSAYLDLLANATPEVIANADDGFAELPAIDRCADVEYVEHRGQRSEDPAIAAVEDEVLAEVARATTLHAAGDYEGALTIADGAVGRAREVGSDLALAHALLVQGSVLAALHRPDEAFDSFSESYRIARTTGTDEVATDASRQAALTAGLALDRPDEGRWWISTALIEARRSDTEEAVASATVAEARLLAGAGRLPEARARLEAVLASIPRGTRLHAAARRELGSVEVRLGELDRGLANLVEARRSDEARLGPDHPGLAESYGDEATALLERSELDDAYEAATRAVAIVEAAYGPDHIAVYPHLDNLANVTWERGDAEKTLEIMRRAKQVRRPTPLGPVAAARVASREAETLLGMGRMGEAIAVYRMALDGSVSALGRWHHATATRRLELANALARDGVSDEALVLVDEALASDLSSLGMKNSVLMRMHDLAASSLALAGKTERAAEQMRRALECTPDPTVASATNVKLHTNLCGLERQAGRGQEAIAACKVALAQASALPGLNRLVRATVHNNACAAYSDTGMLDEAKTECLESLRIQTRDGADADDMLAATVRSNIAEIDLRAGRVQESIDGYARSLATREGLAGARAATLLVPLRGLAQAYLLAGDLDAAAIAATRAVQISEAAARDPIARGHARMLLARALWPNARRRKESNALAAEAAKDLEEAGPRAEKLRGDLEAWRAAPDTAELVPR